jgi:hypothetical protein
VAGFTDEADFGTAASEMGDREKVGAEVRDIEYILQDAHDPFASGVHVDTLSPLRLSTKLRILKQRCPYSVESNVKGSSH